MFMLFLGFFLPAALEGMFLGEVFFSKIEKSCPHFEFLAEKGLEFLPEGQKLSFLALEFSQKC